MLQHATMDMANLNNRQQAQVLNAQTFYTWTWLTLQTNNKVKF